MIAGVTLVADEKAIPWVADETTLLPVAAPVKLIWPPETPDTDKDERSRN